MDYKKVALGLILSGTMVSSSLGEESYQLLVNIKAKPEEEKLKSLGFRECKRLDSTTLSCLESPNLDYLLRLKDFLRSQNIDAKVSKISQQVKKGKEEVKKEINQKDISQIIKEHPQTDEKKDIITKDTSNQKKSLKKELTKKSDSDKKRKETQNVDSENSDIFSKLITDKLTDTENKNNLHVDHILGLINARQKSAKVEKTVERISNLPKKEESDAELLKEMYSLLEAEKLSEALTNARKLLNTRYSLDARFVIGVVNLKRENFKEACEIFSSLKTSKIEAQELEDEACWVYYMKEGYRLLEEGDTKKAFKHFEKSLSYKENLESKVGIFYVYMNDRQIKKAEEVIKNLYSVYPENDTVKKAYVDYLIQTKNIAELSKFQDILTDRQRSLLDEKKTYVELERVKGMLSSGDFETAESILYNLYLKQPSNIYILLNLAYLYLLKDDPIKAENFYKNALLIDKDNKDALRGLKAVYIKLGRYEEAVQVVDKLRSMGVRDEDEKKVRELYFLKKAQESIENKDISKAMFFAEEALKLNSNNFLTYFILSKIYKERGDQESYLRYISKAYELNPEDFGIKLAYLYGLVDFELFEQAKLILRSIDKTKLTETQKGELKDFYRVLYTKLSSFYLDNKDYSRAKMVALEGLNIFKSEAPLFETLGWSCYNLKELECSRRAFESAVSLDRSNQTALLGLAYTHNALKNRDDTIKLLKILENSKDTKVLEGVATLYISLGLYEEAERIIKVIEKYPTDKVKKVYTEVKQVSREPQPKVKVLDREVPYILDDYRESSENSLPDYRLPVDTDKKKVNSVVENFEPMVIGKSSSLENLKEKIEREKQSYLTSVEWGVKVRDKSGNSGKSKLTDSSPYIRINHPIGRKLNVYTGAYFTSLNSGELKDYENFGSPANKEILRMVPSTYSGVEPFGGFVVSGDKFRLDGRIGSTPIVNNGIFSSITYNLEAKLLTESSKFGLGIYRRPIRDSILSYVGTIDPYTEKVSWGRALEEGVKISGEKGNNTLLLYSEFSIGKIKGKDIQENNHYTAIVMPKVAINPVVGDRDFLGLFFMYDSFPKNQDCYYYGCGGYFSPKRLLIAAPMLEGFKFFGQDIGLHYKVFLGMMNMENKGKNSLDTSFDGYIGGIYKLYRNIFFNLAGEYRRTSKYSELFGSLSLQYFFGNRFNITERDLTNQEMEIYKR